MTRKTIVAALCIVGSVIGCGGGGGGGSSSVGNYAGVWDISAVRVLNDCGLPLPLQITVSPTVNQDGTRIVVDSGSVVFTGSTNDEDGFSVRSADTQDANGCVSASAYSFKNASDGNAEVGIAIAARCPGAVNRECVVGYGGTGTRRNTNRLKTAAVQQSEDQTITGITEILADAVRSGSGEAVNTTEVETVTDLAELITPVQ